MAHDDQLRRRSPRAGDSRQRDRNNNSNNNRNNTPTTTEGKPVRPHSETPAALWMKVMFDDADTARTRRRGRRVHEQDAG
jgi:hypothetical protein